MRRGSDSSSQSNRLPAPASSSSSPTADECRVFANLSPLEKAEPYIQRFKGANNYTSRRQLFTSPQQQTIFKEANPTSNSNVHGDVLQIHRSDKENISPSECVLANPDELNNSIDSTNSKSGSDVPDETIRQPDDRDTGTRDQEVQPHKMDQTTGDQRSHELSEVTPKDLNNVESTTEGSYSIILNGVEYDVGNFDGRGPSSDTCLNGGSHSNKKIVDASQVHNISSRPVSNKDAMDTDQNQCGTDRNLQPETANDSRSIVRCSSYTSENPTYNFAGLRSFSDAKQKGVCNYALPISMKSVSQYGHDLVRKLDCSSALLSLADTQPSSLQENQNVEQHVVESSSRFEELDQMSPKRKRKRASITGESDGCKLCNCKRSKCLKLYCECFAAGIYCLDTCACVNCFNKPEYEDTVLDARQQIESRNPHAFAPKVVKHAMESPRTMTEERNGTASSSARHKRGCNCKKSKCRKKYCECYQSKVGCSEGCRCDNCQNSFGTRKETVYERVERQKNESHEKMNAGQANSIKAMGLGGAQFSSTWPELGNASNFNPSAVHSTSSNLWNHTEVPQSQYGNRVQADGSFHWQYPPQVCTQQLDRSAVLHDYARSSMTSVMTIHQMRDIMKDSNVPQTLEVPSTP